MPGPAGYTGQFRLQVGRTHVIAPLLDRKLRNDPDPLAAVPDLILTDRIKLNERILLLSIFERIACTTPDNCPHPAQRGEAAGRPTVSSARRSATSLGYEAANETARRRLHVHGN